MIENEDDLFKFVEKKEGLQTEHISRSLPPRTCGNRYIEDEDFFFEESERQVRIRESFDKEGKFLIKE